MQSQHGELLADSSSVQVCTETRASGVAEDLETILTAIGAPAPAPGATAISGSSAVEQSSPGELLHQMTLTSLACTSLAEPAHLHTVSIGLQAAQLPTRMQLDSPVDTCCHAEAELPLSIRLATMAMHAHKFLEEYAAHTQPSAGPLRTLPSLGPMPAFQAKPDEGTQTPRELISGDAQTRDDTLSPLLGAFHCQCPPAPATPSGTLLGVPRPVLAQHLQSAFLR